MTARASHPTIHNPAMRTQCRDPRFALWTLSTAPAQASPVTLFTHTVNVSALLAVQRGAHKGVPHSRADTRSLCMTPRHKYPECCQHGMRNEDARAFTLGGFAAGSTRRLFVVYHRHRRMYLQQLLPATQQEVVLKLASAAGGDQGESLLVGGARRDGADSGQSAARAARKRARQRRGKTRSPEEEGEGARRRAAEAALAVERGDRRLRDSSDDAEGAESSDDGGKEGAGRGRNEKNWAPWHDFPPWAAPQSDADPDQSGIRARPDVDGSSDAHVKARAEPASSFVLITYSIWPHVVLNCSTVKARRARGGSRRGCVEIARTDTSTIFRPVQEACASSAADDLQFEHAKDARKGCVFGVHLATNLLPIKWENGGITLEHGRAAAGGTATRRSGGGVAAGEECTRWRMLGVFSVKDFVHHSYAAYYYLTDACHPYSVRAISREPIGLAAVPLACRLLTGFQCVTYATSLHWAPGPRSGGNADRLMLGYGFQDMTSRLLVQPLSAVLDSLEWLPSSTQQQQHTLDARLSTRPEGASASEESWPSNPLARLPRIAVNRFELSRPPAGAVEKPRLVLVMAYHKMGAAWMREVMRFFATDLKREIHKSWMRARRKRDRGAAGAGGGTAMEAGSREGSNGRILKSGRDEDNDAHAFTKPEPILCEGGFASTHPCFQTFSRALEDSVCFDGVARARLLDAGLAAGAGAEPERAPPLFLAFVASPTERDLKAIGEVFDFRAVAILRDPRDVLLSAAHAHREPMARAPWDTVPPWLQPRRARSSDPTAADELDLLPARRTRSGAGGASAGGRTSDVLFGGLPWIASSVKIREEAERVGSPPMGTTASAVVRTLPPWLVQEGGVRFQTYPSASYHQAAAAQPSVTATVSFEAKRLTGCVLRQAHAVYRATDLNRNVLFVRYEDLRANYKVGFHRISKWLFPQAVHRFDVARAFETAAHKLTALAHNATAEATAEDLRELLPLTREFKEQGAWCDESARDRTGTWQSLEREFGNMVKDWGYADCQCATGSVRT